MAYSPSHKRLKLPDVYKLKHKHVLQHDKQQRLGFAYSISAYFRAAVKTLIKGFRSRFTACNVCRYPFLLRNIRPSHTASVNINSSKKNLCTRPLPSLNGCSKLSSQNRSASFSISLSLELTSSSLGISFNSFTASG